MESPTWDRNPDDIVEKPPRSIYGITKSQPRQTILWWDLDRSLTDYAGQTLRMLDVGGGEGQIATLTVQWSHHVTLYDLPAETATRAQRAIGEQGMSDNMYSIHCVVQGTPQYLDSQTDLVLLHTMLGWVADLQAVLKTSWSMLRPGGTLSLIFCNTSGLLIHDVLIGNFGYVQQRMYKKKRCTLSPSSPHNPQQVYGWLKEVGQEVIGRVGVRVSRDYLCDRQRQHDCFDASTEIGARYCRQGLYIGFGRYTHITAIKRPARAADAGIARE